MDELMVRAGGSTTIGDAFLCDETRGVSKTLTFFQSRAKIVLSPAARASPCSVPCAATNCHHAREA